MEARRLWVQAQVKTHEQIIFTLIVFLHIWVYLIIYNERLKHNVILSIFWQCAYTDKTMVRCRTWQCAKQCWGVKHGSVHLATTIHTSAANKWNAHPHLRVGQGGVRTPKRSHKDNVSIDVFVQIKDNLVKVKNLPMKINYAPVSLSRI